MDPFEHFNFEDVHPASPDGHHLHKHIHLGGERFEEYHYEQSLTPYVTSINRLNATTAGGTTVILNGTGFLGKDGDGSATETEVFLAGIRCATRYEQIGSYRGQHLCLWDGVNCEGLGVTATSIRCLVRWGGLGGRWVRESPFLTRSYTQLIDQPLEHLDRRQSLRT